MSALSWLGRILGRPDPHIAEVNAALDQTRRSTRGLIRVAKEDMRQSSRAEADVRRGLDGIKAANGEMEKVLDSALRALSEKK